MATEIEIANRALQKLGEGRIVALTDDSKAAREMSAAFDAVRDAEIARHRWRFALKRALLQPLVTAPVFGYTVQYQLPTDMLVLDFVGEYAWVDLSDYINSTDVAPYSIEGDKLLSRVTGDTYIRYRARITNTALYPAPFCEALSARLAYELCETLTGSGSKKGDLASDYEQCLREARRANAIQNPPEKIADDSWLLARL